MRSRYNSVDGHRAHVEILLQLPCISLSACSPGCLRAQLFPSNQQRLVNKIQKCRVLTGHELSRFPRFLHASRSYNVLKSSWIRTTRERNGVSSAKTSASPAFRASAFTFSRISLFLPSPRFLPSQSSSQQQPSNPFPSLSVSFLQ